MNVEEGEHHSAPIEGSSKIAHHHILGEGFESFTPDFVEKSLASREFRNSVYDKLLTGELSDLHLAYMEARGCDWDMCRKFRYTTNSADWRTRAEIARDISSQIEPHGVSGFWKDGKGEWRLENPSGILLPVKDLQGNIFGCQVLTDEVINDWAVYGRRKMVSPAENIVKYKWLSSAPFKAKDKTSGDSYWTRKTGTRAESAPHFINLQISGFYDKVSNEKIIITEGVHKANLVAHFTGEAVIGLIGVGSSHLQVASTVAAVPEVVLALDIDWISNENVHAALNSLLRTIESSRGHLNGVSVAFWEPEYKGMDDLLLANKEVEQYLPAQEWRREFGEQHG